MLAEGNTMREIHIRGEKPLYGTIHIHGAKNRISPVAIVMVQV